MKRTALHEFLRALFPLLDRVLPVDLPLRGFRRQIPVSPHRDSRANLLSSLVVCELLVSLDPIANSLRPPCRGRAALARAYSPILASPQFLDEVPL